MKKFFSWLIVLAMSITMLSTDAKAAQAVDLNGHWAQQVMEEWLAKGFISGYSDGTVKPDNLISRAEFFVLVNKSFGFSYTTSINFSDVKATAWYYNAVSIAIAAGYVSGYSNNTIQPERYITREEAAVILANVSYLTPYETGGSIYSDVNNTRASIAYIGAVSNAGIMKGYPDGSFRPDGNMTRAEAVASINGALIRRGQNTGAYIQPIENQLQASSGLVAITPNTGNTQTTTSSSKSSSSNSTWKDVDTFDTTVKSSSFGSSRDDTSVNGNLLIDVNSCTLRNIDISGDLVISSRAKGTITLNNVSVSGTIYIEGSPRLNINDSDVNDIMVKSSSSNTRISAKDDSNVGAVYLFSGATIEESSSRSKSVFGDIIIEDSVKSNARIDLYGYFDNVDVYASRIKLNLNRGEISHLMIDETAERSAYYISSGTVVDNVDINARNVVFSGSGRIRTANIYNKYTSFSTRPENIYDSDYGYSVDGSSSGGGDYYLTVRVEDWDTERSIVNATVVLSIDDEVYRTATTNDIGEVHFYNLSRGDYTVSVSKDGYFSKSESVYMNYDDHYTDISLRKTSGSTAAKDFLFTVGTGSADLQDANVVIKRSGVNLVGKTSYSGTVLFSGLEQGTYTYTVTKSGYIKDTGTIEVRENNSDNRKTIILTPIGGTQKTTVTFKVVEGAAGTTPTPVSGAAITVNGTLYGTNTNSNGEVSIPDISIGSSLSYSVAHGTRTVTGTATVTTNMTITVNMTTVNPSVVPRSIIFTVTDQNDGSAISAAKVSINRSSDGSQAATGDTVGTGKVTLSVPDGSYTYKIEKSGYKDVTGTLTVTGDSTIAASMVKYLTGTFKVVDGSNALLLGATVTVTNDSNPSDVKTIPTNSANNGVAVFDKLEDGQSYTYKVVHGSKITQTGTFTASAAAVPVSAVKDIAMVDGVTIKFTTLPVSLPIKIYDASHVLQDTVTTDASGTIEADLTSITSGNMYYYLVGTGTATHGVKSGSFTATSGTEVNITVPVAVPVTVTVEDSTSVGTMIGGAVIKAFDVNTGELIETQTTAGSGADMGKAIFDKLVHGQIYKFEISATGYNPNPTVFSPTTIDFANHPAFTLTP